MIPERLTALREEMKRRSIDIYVVPTADFHESEYVGEHFKARKFITGFTGSAGTAVITLKEAGLWTDGRYFVQAEKQLEGSTVTLYRMAEEGVPTVEEFVKDKLPQGGCIGFDGRTVNGAWGEKFVAIAEEKKGSLFVGEDLINLIWTDRPELSKAPLFILEEKYSGKSTAEKIKDVRAKMAEEGADFDEVLKDAQEKGYAEKDPTADIEGHDPCRKIAILTSLVCGRQVDFEDIHCEGITKITADDFKYAKVLNRSIKLLASSRKVGNSYSCMVAPFMLSAEHPLCGVNGVFNGIFVHGNVLGDAMFYGSGAGKLPTASAVVADIVDMTKHKNTNIYIDWSPEKLTLVDYKDSVNSFFVRTSSGKETIENAFGSVEYADAGIAGEIGFTTKDMTEAEFEKAAAQIEVRNRIRLG